MSAALLALRNAIATNTLNAAQQGALTQALDAIIPTFPEPDPSGVAQPPPDEDDSREWIAALYTIQAEGGGGGPVTSAGTIIAADGPTLSAQTVTGLSNGQPAIVESFGAEFTLQPVDGMTTDGSTILTSTDPARVWLRGDTVIAEQALIQTAWHVNPATGNDNNNGLTAGTAVQHKAEIMRRWGTWSPTLTAVAVVVTFEAGDSLGDTDPWLAEPTFVKGASLTLQPGTLTPNFTGTLLAVTAKSVGPAGNLMHSTVTTTTGALAVGMLVVNLTRANSVAFVQRNRGGGDWQFSQPVSSYTGGVPNQTTNDLWANGDSLQAFTLPSVDIAVIGGQVAGYDASFDPSYIVANLTIFDPLGPGNFNACFLEPSANFVVNNCNFQRAETLRNGGLQNPVFLLNCVHEFPLLENMQFTQGVLLSGGYLQTGGNMRGVQLLNGFMIPPSTTLVLDTTQLDVQMVALTPPDVFLDTTGAIETTGQVQMVNANARVWGPGTLNVLGNFYYTGAEATALQCATIQLNGDARGYSNATSGGLTAIHNLALSAANLAAAAGATGFGHFAWGGGASIGQPETQP